MIKFYGKGGAVWSDKSKSIIARFVDGVFETNDIALAKELTSKGYESDGEIDTEPTEEIKEIAPAKPTAAKGGVKK